MAVASRYLTEERLELQSRAREFALREALPLANQLDRQKADIPRWFLERMAGMGYFGITIPREFGGLGLGVFEYCLISEELARAWMSVASIIARGNGIGAGLSEGSWGRDASARSTGAIAAGPGKSRLIA